jgi:hypothetical protein
MRIALVCIWLLACSNDEARPPRETYDYVVTPAGQRYRVIQAGPILRGANTSLGLRITYVAQGRTSADLAADADALIAALGPELQLAGENAVIVRARIGPPTVVLGADKKRGEDLEYRLEPSGFQRASAGAGASEVALAGTNQPDDPTFPYRAQQLTAAGEASARWVALLDQNDLTAIRVQLTQRFRDQLADDATFRELLAQRTNAGLPGTRRELYRMQERATRGGRTPGDDALIVYECTTQGGPNVLERLTWTREGEEWRVVSYAFQPLP